MTFDQRAKADAGMGVVDTARAQPEAASSPPTPPAPLAESGMTQSLDGLAGKSVTPDEQRAVVVDNQDAVAAFMKSREWGNDAGKIRVLSALEIAQNFYGSFSAAECPKER